MVKSKKMGAGFDRAIPVARPGSIIVVDLENPREKHLGALLELSPAGLWIKGINLDSFDQWLREVENSFQTVAVATSFFPMLRIGRITLDQTAGGIPSYEAIVRQRLGAEIKNLFYC
jgi:hypothetical protein